MESWEDFARRGLPAPSEAMVRESCLKKGVEAPDLAAMKDFARFSAAASKGKIVELPTADSLNTFLEWFLPDSPASQELRQTPRTEAKYIT